MTTISVEDNGVLVQDLQLWHSSTIPIKSHDIFTRLRYVEYQAVPLFLLQSKPIDVYSTLDATSDYINTNLRRYKELGILCQSQNDANLHIVIFIQNSIVKCFILDFSGLNQLINDKQDYDESLIYVVDFKTNVTNTNVFDKVLEKKKRIKPTVPLVQENGEQVNSMITKVILSGLRLRGLSNSSTNDKLKIKEIYQMTFKATTFAIKKFDTKVKLTDIQDIVEKLLQVFVDVNDDSPFVD